MDNREKIIINAELQQAVRSDMAWHYRIIPKSLDENYPVFFIDNEQDLVVIKEELDALFGCSVALIPHDSVEIQQALGRYFRKAGQSNLLNLDRSIDFVDRIIQDANHLGSSDIHIEIYQEKARVRIRIDGLLIERFVIDKNEYSELINKIKIRTKLDISEKRLPQDGRINYDSFDIRVSILPTLYGEKVVMRILGKDASSLHINDLGMNSFDLENYLEGIKKPNGIILISGPTGSGKTTTLYATLKQLNNEKRNIVTVEDPIEYTLSGINQVQLKEQIGLTFSSALRSFLRQDPDIIMLGEIRDSETAQMAIRAALTGHLVLSTIHTNSAWGTVSRLKDMGIPPFLLSGTLTTSVAQRLVRKLCEKCKCVKETDLTFWPKTIALDLAPKNIFEAVGCDDCHYTGYAGRTAIYEVIPIDAELAEFIRKETDDIKLQLKSKKIRSLGEQALELLINGTSSLEELYPLIMEI